MQNAVLVRDICAEYIRPGLKKCFHSSAKTCKAISVCPFDTKE